MYIYANHMGGYFGNEEFLKLEDLYCEQCGDYDEYLGEVDTYEECVDLIYHYTHGDEEDDIPDEYTTQEEIERQQKQDHEYAEEQAKFIFSEPNFPWDYIKLPKEPMFTEDIEVTSRGMNKKIKFNILEEAKMREIGFTDYNKDTWYISKDIDKEGDITFNIVIYKDGSDAYIDVLDENFGQPYDYQKMLNENPPTNKFAYYCFTRVEELMKEFEDYGIISGHVYGEYI